MGQELGRISGAMLKANLERFGIDLSVDDDLLYLDVNNNRVGVNTDGVNADLEVNLNTQSTFVIVDNSQTVSNIVFNANGTIGTVTGPLIIQPLGNDPVITVNRLQTENLEFSDASIRSLVTNSPIEFRPNGTGEIDVFANTTIFGNLRATGNVTLDGDITIGSDDTDSVEFLADINSDIIPDQTGTYSFGSSQKQWSELHTTLINGSTIEAGSSLAINGIDITLPQGNIWYVSVSGDDIENNGNHQDGSFATIAKALSVATDGDTVYIYPGTYQEVFPLTVPIGVAVLGTGIRSVQIAPTPETNSNDAFLLNGQTSIQNVTIRDFSYNSVADTGYAVRFAPNTVISSRSPYVQNITVITSGSITSIDDPRGFDQGDAGRGALVDGADVDATSIDASMLFYSSTFITPNADALTMTNGVRVEWLNCFSYFANRGLYATQGVTGHVMPDGVTIRYGAELRSIGSANIYGNFGAVADGADTLMYLITHNFAYIGTGKDASNDTTLVNQLNEVVQLNLGQIRYNTQDQGGNYRVGDSFFVDFATGNTSFAVGDISLLGISSLRFTNNGEVTFINAEKIETGNFRIVDNTILNVTSDPIIQSAGGTIRLNSDSFVQGDVSVTGNVTVAGQVIFGNETTDTVSVIAQVASDIVPDTTSEYDFGSSSKVWNTVHLNNIDTGNIKVFNTTISTTESNSDLELTANGLGFIKISDLVVNQNIEITQSSALSDTGINGNVSHTGDKFQTGNVTQTGNRNIIGELQVGSAATLAEITIETNVITASDSDLILGSASLGKILIATNDININKNIEVVGTLFSANITVVNAVNVSGLTNNSILIDTNTIRTLLADTNLVLQATSAGLVLIPSNNVLITNDITADGVTSLATTELTGSLLVNGLLEIQGSRTQTGASTVTSNVTVTDVATLGQVKFNTNTITTITGDLELDSAGTGISLIPSSDVLVNGNISVSGNTAFASIDITNAISFAKATNNQIEIQGNYIAGIVTDNDLIIQSAGSGLIYSPDTDFLINNNLTVVSSASLSNVAASNITLNQLLHTGDKTQTGNINLSGSVVADNAVLSSIVADTNFISTTIGDLDLRAAGTGILGIFSNDVIVNTDISIIGQTTLSSVTINNNVQANKMSTSLLLIDDNFIQSTGVDQDIELRASGVGLIYISDSFIGELDLTVSGSSSFSDIEVQETLTGIGTTTQLGQRQQVGNLQTEKLSAGDYASSGLSIAGNVITATLNDLILQANSVGKIYAPDNNVVIDTALTVAGLSTVAILQTNTARSNELVNGNILIQDNFITTTESNSNLEIKANGTGGAWLEQIQFVSSTINSVINDANIELTPFPSNGVVIDSTTSLRIPVGTSAERSVLEISDLRFNLSVSAFEGFSTARRTLGGLFSADRNTYVISESVKFANDNQLTFVTNNVVSMKIDNAAMTVTGLNVDNNIAFNNNQISTIQPSANINLLPAGSGQVQFTPVISLIENQFSNTAIGFEPVKFSSTGNGYVKFVGTNGIVVPFGTDADRIFQETGEIRWNTQRQTLEIFDGSSYISAGGVGGITAEFMDELSNIYAIILG